MCQKVVGAHGLFVKWGRLLIPKWKLWLLSIVFFYFSMYISCFYFAVIFFNVIIDYFSK